MSEIGKYKNINIETVDFKGIVLTLQETHTIEKKYQHRWWHLFHVKHKEDTSSERKVVNTKFCEKCEYMEVVTREIVNSLEKSK